MCSLSRIYHALSDAETNIIEAARLLLGEPLSNLLLSDYLEEYGFNRRVFIAIHGKDSDGITYQFETVNNSELGLPAGHDPAVFAALLQLPVKIEGETDALVFRDDVIGEMLRWPNTPESQLTIRQAVERYFSTEYYLVNTQLPPSSLISGRYSRFRRLISSHETVTELYRGKQVWETSYMTVQFPLNFISNLLAGRRYFFDMNFDMLVSLEQIN